MGAINAATGLHGVGSGTALAVGAGASSRVSLPPAAKSGHCQAAECARPGTRRLRGSNSRRAGSSWEGSCRCACARAWESGGPGARRAFPGLRSFGGGGTGWGCTCRLSLSRLPPLSPPGSPESPGSSGSRREREKGRERREGWKERGGIWVSGENHLKFSEPS